MEPPGAVLQDHAVAVRDGLIEAVLPRAAAETRFPSYALQLLDEHVLIPGLVNAHSGATAGAMPGAMPGAWPRMLSGGTTCFNDSCLFPEAALEAALDAGMRICVGMIVSEAPSAYAADPDDYLAKGLALRDRRREHARVSFCLAGQPALSDESLRKLAKIAAEVQVPVHLDLRADLQGTAIGRLRQLGLLGPELSAVHAVPLEESEIALLARHGASVVHCPSSSLLQSRGFAPLARMAAAGINLALGTDAAASGRLDMLGEMRLAALLAKAIAAGPAAIPAHAALRAATLGGARALGLESQIGSIVPGKAADLAAVRVAGEDPVSELLYVSGEQQVSHVWVEGRRRLP